MTTVLVELLVGIALWIVLSSRIERLTRRLARIEEQAAHDRKRLAELRTRLGLEPEAPPVAEHAPLPTPVVPPPAVKPRPRRKAIDPRALLAKLPMWLGSVALALAGVFLVKYGWERDWLGPAARIGLAFGFGLALLAAATVVRRKSAGVAQGLAAAGIAVLYAATLAGVQVHHLIPPAFGFALLAGTTFTAVGLALVHGPWVAVLGLVGGYLTPAWIGARDPSAVSLFGYLVLLHGGLVASARARGWRFLPLASAAAALLWAAAWAWFGPTATSDSAALALFAALVAASCVVLGELGPTFAGSRLGRVLALGGPLATLLILAGAVETRSFEPFEWALFGSIGAGCVLLARWRRDLDALAWMALAGTVLVLFSWAIAVPADELGSFAGTCTAFGLGFTLAGGLFSRSGPTPWIDAARASTAAVAILVVARLGLYRVESIRWGTVGLAVAAVLAGFAWFALPRCRAMFTVGAATAAAFGMAVVSPAWRLAPGLAALALALAVVYAEYADRTTRFAGWIYAVLAALACLSAPAFDDWPYGPWRLALGIGAATVLLAAAVRPYRARGDALDESIVALAATIAGGTVLVFEIREAFRPDRYPGLVEWSVLTTVGALYGLAVRAVGERYRVARLSWIGDLVALASLAVGTPILAGLLNPQWTRFLAGDTPIVNRLVVVYGLTTAAAAFAALVWRRAGRRWLPAIAGTIAVVLGFLFVTFEVRQAFRGSDLTTGTASVAELYGYSVAWIALSLILLATSRRTRGRLVGIASAVVMAIAVVKVFLFDTGSLTGLYRVASLLGLGLTLLGLTYVYQRWVFVHPPDAPPPQNR